MLTTMESDPRHWPTGEHEELFATIASLKNRDETERFLRDLCTISELDAMAHRWQVARLLDEGLPYLEVAKRALAFPCRNAPVEALLVRADDIPEYVQDGVVDCGITGLDIVRERGADVVE